MRKAGSIRFGTIPTAGHRKHRKIPSPNPVKIPGGTSKNIPVIRPSQPVILVKTVLLIIAIEKRIIFIPPKK